MSQDSNYIKITKRFILLISLLFILITIYEVTYTVFILNTTGTLVVNSPGAFISIEQNDLQFANLGTSYNKVRLVPGSYNLILSKGFNQIVKPIFIKKNKTVKIDIMVNNSQISTQSLIISNTNKAINFLPFIGPNFTYKIDYRYNVTPQVAIPVITITSPDDSGRESAINWLKAIGFNPNLLNIEYITGLPTPLSNNSG